MNRRFVRTGALWAAVVLSLAAFGCGGGGGGGGTNNPPAAVPTATAVGAPTGAVVSKTIGAAGGDVTSGDGNLTVTVPAGALAADTDIGIQPVENKAFGGFGSGYELTPDGQVFAQPVTLDFTYTDADLAGAAPEALAVAFQTPDDYWQLVDDISVDTVAKTVSATTTHFTKYSGVERFHLNPLDAIVKVNTAARFFVLQCYGARGQTDAQGHAPTLGSDCFPIGSKLGAEILSNWAVNSVVGGDGDHGTVVGSNNKGDYLAPLHPPDPRDVALSVNLKDPDKPSVTATLVANITVVEDGVAGIVNFKGTRDESGVTINYTGTAKLTYVAAEVFDGGTRYDLPYDPALAKISFTQWDEDDGSRVCHLVGTADSLIIPPIVPPVPAGSLFVYSSLSSYLFGALLSAEGTQECTNPDDSVDTEPIEASVYLTTAATDGDPGFQPLGDGFPLVDSVNSTFEFPEGGGTVTQAIDWSLKPVDVSLAP